MINVVKKKDALPFRIPKNISWRPGPEKRDQSSVLGETGRVGQLSVSTFQRVAAHLQTRKPRETRSQNLKCAQLILEHSL